MSGFKNFLLRGNLVDLAVAFIVGAAFSSVVTALTALITSNISGLEETFAGAEEGSLGYFLNALISFVTLAAVVYFVIVLPYTKLRERYFPSPPPGTPEDIELLRQIRDALVDRTSGTPGTGSATDAQGPRA